MHKEMLELKEKFERIKMMGWIKEKRKGFTGIGYTFETLLGKKEDSLPLPDYGCFEIKTINTNKKTDFCLFTLTPDGDYPFPIKRILKELGHCSSPNKPWKKVFYHSFNTQNYTSIGKFKKGKIFVNRQEEKVELLVYNDKGKNVRINISWSFHYLQERLLLKLQYLALVKASSRIINEEGYFYYKNIAFYKLKGFNTFLHLIEQGIVSIIFKIDTFQDGKRMGQVYDHGTSFSINMNNLYKLYIKLM